jgi:hypothetical protein
MNPLPNRLMRSFYAKVTQNIFCFLSGQLVAWRRTANALTGIAARSFSQDL